MAEAAGASRSPRALPSLADALGWVDFQLDDLEGAGVARVMTVFADAETSEPVWLAAKLGRFSKTVAIPFADCAAGVGEVWTPHKRDEIRGAPGIDASRPLTREQELTLCAYFQIHDGIGRASDILDRPEGAITSQAASDVS